MGGGVFVLAGSVRAWEQVGHNDTTGVETAFDGVLMMMILKQIIAARSYGLSPASY